MRELWHDLSYVDHDEFCRSMGCTPLCPPDATALASLRAAKEAAKLPAGSTRTEKGAYRSRTKKAWQQSVRRHVAEITDGGREIVQGFYDLAKSGNDSIKLRAWRELRAMLCGKEVVDRVVEHEHFGEVEHNVTGGVVHAHVAVNAPIPDDVPLEDLLAVERLLARLDAPKADVIDVVASEAHAPSHPRP